MSAQSMEFFDVWETYRKVVANDYMFHKDIGAAVGAALTARFSGEPYALLDLGCGDASAFIDQLRAAPPARYVGVDLSETALAIAAQTLAALPCDTMLKNADLLDALREPAQYDAIYSSFAVHHLTTEMKAEFFRLAAERLAPGGLLLLVDTVREDGEALDLYRRNYAGAIRAGWSRLSALEQDFVCDHLFAADLPETYGTLAAQAEAAGMAPAPGGTKHGWHRLMCFSKP